MSRSNKTTWVIVAGGFHQRGGMDKANYALAQYLSESGRRVHLVSHDVDDDVRRMPLTEVTLVQRPLQSVFLGEFALDRAGRSVRRRLESSGRSVRMVANGSSCLLGDVNWVHYVHGAWRGKAVGGSAAVHTRNVLQYRTLCSREKIAFRRAKLILTNSILTANHVAACLKGDPRKISTIYLGADPLSPIREAERAAAREKLNLASEIPVAAFVGSLGLDSRKGFDVLLKAWQILSRRPGWKAQLVVAGGGGALEACRDEARKLGLEDSVRFLGFSNEVSSILAASDVLVSPVRYEPYGLNIQEALSRGLAILTSDRAGIAERFSPDLTPLLIRDPESADELVHKTLLWHEGRQDWARRFRRLGDELRERTWGRMSQDIVQFVESALGA